MEQYSIERLNKLHPAIKEDALKAYLEAVKETPKGVHPFIVETLRTFKRSEALFNQPHDGIDNDGDGKIDEPDERVTNAKAGQSYHNYGLALDFALLLDNELSWKVDKNWKLVISIFKKYGFESGGDWKGKLKDYPHLEKRFGIHWKELLKRYLNKDFIEGTNYVKI